MHPELSTDHKRAQEESVQLYLCLNTIESQQYLLHQQQRRHKTSMKKDDFVKSDSSKQ